MSITAPQLEVDEICIRLNEVEKKLCSLVTWLGLEYGSEDGILRNIADKDFRTATGQNSQSKYSKKPPSLERNYEENGSCSLNPVVVIANPFNLRSRGEDNQANSIESENDDFCTEYGEVDFGNSIPGCYLDIPLVSIKVVEGEEAKVSDSKSDRYEDPSIQETESGSTDDTREIAISALREATKSKSTRCEICDKDFALHSSLKRHLLKIHLPETTEEFAVKSGDTQPLGHPNPWVWTLRNYSCQLCNRHFKKLGNAKKHHKLVHQEIKIKPHVSKKVNCDACGNIFASKSSLNSHMKSVHQPRKYICIVCGKLFARNQDLKEHMQGHSEKRNYKCPYCEKTFRWKKAFGIHKSRHLGLSKVQCTLCGKVLVNSHSLREHIQIVHENLRRYACSMCDKRFKTHSSWKYHEQTHSNPNTKNRGLNKDRDGALVKRNDPAGRHFIRQVNPDEIAEAGTSLASFRIIEEEFKVVS